MENCAVNKTFVSPPKFYNLLFNRLCLKNVDFLYKDNNPFKKLLAKQIIQMGDELVHKSLVHQVLHNYYWDDIIIQDCKFKFTSSFLNNLFDDYLNEKSSHLYLVVHMLKQY